MIIADKKNEAGLIALAPSIKNNMHEWQIVKINISPKSAMLPQAVMKQLQTQYREYEGMIYAISPRKIVMLARLGLIDNYATMKTELESKIPNHNCRVLLRKMSAIGLRQVQIDLSAKNNSMELAEGLYEQRVARKDNIIMIADDDSFIRKSLNMLLSASGDITEIDDGANVIKSYLQCNPDMVFLDIHMPNKTGLDLISEILEVDSDACIVMLSADSQKDNIVLALESGAIGFLTKPPSKNKIQEYISQCLTIT